MQGNSHSESGPLPSIVICPPTVTGHWLYEVEKFVSHDHLNPLHYVGSPAERLRYIILRYLNSLHCGTSCRTTYVHYPMLSQLPSLWDLLQNDLGTLSYIISTPSLRDLLQNDLVTLSYIISSPFTMWDLMQNDLGTLSYIISTPFTKWDLFQNDIGTLSYIISTPFTMWDLLQNDLVTLSYIISTPFTVWDLLQNDLATL